MPAPFFLPVRPDFEPTELLPFKLGIIVVALALVAAITVVPIVSALRLAARAGRRFVESTLAPLYISSPPQRSTIYASDGSVLGSVYRTFNRQVVSLRQVNPTTREAVLAIEDARFYEHDALDVRALIRAFIIDVSAGRIVEGGSTIAQQLAKDAFTGGALTLSRKLHEAVDAIRLERTYSKDQILQIYLNEVYLGNGVYGVAAAAEFYFGERPDQLTLAQSALLAGMIASPASFDPIRHPRMALARRNEVLLRMRYLGWIEAAQYQQALLQPIRLSSRRRHMSSPGPTSYWEQFVIGQFLEDPAFGPTVRKRAQLLFQGGLRIYTTLDPAFQRDAELAIQARMTGAGLPQSALVAVVPETGAIRAMAIGKWPFHKHKYNLATDPGGGRSAGSAFKAFTLAAALEAGISPNAVYNGDSPKTIANCGGGQTWTLHNAEPGSGNYPLWLATADSVNAVFAQVINQVGPDNVARVAHLMGITNPLVPVCPLTLGTSPVSPLQMTSGFATLADGGIHCVPFAIASVVSSTGLVLERTKPECTRAIPAGVAAEETAMLENVVRFGTGTAANIGRAQAGKTGTGNNYEDAWFLGYVPQLATGVWVGYARAEIGMPSVPGYGPGFGGVLAAPIWHDFMLAATRGMPPRGFPPPPIPIGGSAPGPSPTPRGSPTPTPTATASPTHHR